jgi:hypothetical protein
MARRLIHNTRSELMKYFGKAWKIPAAAAVALLLAACDQGPLEKAGKALDRTGEKVGDKAKDIAK